MIFVDSSVWIDYLRGLSTAQTEKLDAVLGVERVAVGDVVITEVLQGCPTKSVFDETRRIFDTLDFVTVGGCDVAVAAAENFIKLRELGYTVRKTIDTMIATRCILDHYLLLHNDRDFDPFEKHLGLECF